MASYSPRARSVRYPCSGVHREPDVQLQAKMLVENFKALMFLLISASMMDIHEQARVWEVNEI